MVKISMDTFVKRFQPERYDLWLRGEDVGPHPEDSRQTAAPMPSQMDLLCANNSSGQLPPSYLSAVPKNKRHTIHRKKNITDTNPDVNMSELVNRSDIPADVKKVLQDLELEETDEPPDEQQLEVLEDIWLKAGELDMSEAVLYTEKGFRKKGRKRKKKPPSGIEKERRDMRARKQSAKNTNGEASSSSGSSLKTNNYLDIIGGPIPCLVLPDLKIHQPELLSSGVTSESDGGTVTVKTEEASMSDLSEATDKSGKRKKRPAKNSEHKKHKQKHVYKSKRKQVPNVPVFSTTEPLDVSDADVQRKLMAMPSLSAQKFAEPPCDTKIGILSTTTSMESSEIDECMTFKVENEDVDVEDVKPPRTLSPVEPPKIDPGNIKVEMIVPKLEKEEYIEEDPVQFCDAATSVNMSDSSTDTNSNSFAIMMNKAVGTNLMENPTPSYARKDIIKAARLSVLKKQYSSFDGNNVRVVQPIAPDKPLTSEDDKDVCKAVDGLLVLQQRSRVSLQDSKLCSNTGTLFMSSPSFPRTNDPLHPQMTIKEVTSLKGQSGFEQKQWGDKVEVATNTTNVNVATNHHNSINPSTNQTFTFGLDRTTNWDPQFQGVKNSPDISKQYKPTIMHKFWPNSSPKDQSSDVIEIPTPFALSQSIQIAGGQTSLVLTAANKNGYVTARPYSAGTKGNNTASAVIPVTTSTRLASIADNKNKCESAVNLPSFITMAARVPAPNTLTVLLQPARETVVRQPRKRMPMKIVKTPIESQNVNVDGTKSNMCSIATQVDNLTPLEAGSNVAKSTITLERRVDSNIIQVDGTMPEPSNSVKPTSIPLLPNANDNSVSAIRSHLQNIGPPVSCMGVTYQKAKKPAANKRKPKEKEKKTAAIRNSQTIDLPPPVLSIEGRTPTPIRTKNTNRVAKTPAAVRYPAIPGHISKMVYPNVPPIDLLQAFNDYWGAQVSHCAICTTFASTKSGGCRQMPPDWKYCKPTVLPESSPIWVSSSLFAANSKEQGIEPENDKLLSCRGCHVTVHASCYGITVLPSDLHNWACDKCKAGMVHVTCCLCPMRGGAIKRTSDSQWAHILCALLIPGVTFKDAVNKDPINVLTIQTNIVKQLCCCCGQKIGACLRCYRCDALFHPSCGLVAGATFIIPAYNSPELQITCHGHDNGKERFSMIRQGETVWAKHRNKRYYKAKVDSIHDTLFYMVTFSDNSFSDDLYPADITNYDPGNPPAIGAAVTVDWTDKHTYDGIFEGTNHRIMYTVIFEDGSQLVVKRNQIYSLQEDLPKRVRSRLSMATEMKHRYHLYGVEDESDAQKKVKQSRKFD